MIAAAISTVTAGGAGGTAYTLGYLTPAATEAVASSEDASPDSAAADGTAVDGAAVDGTTSDRADTPGNGEPASGGASDDSNTATTPATDPFDRAGMASMPGSYGAADTTPARCPWLRLRTST